uniref:Uncharacterized protein n=1 Tax=Megaselia scalaris TaxID=36166 RepID=T1GWW4_MEGSC
MCFKKRLLIAGISVFLAVLLINFDIVEFINVCRINLSPRIIFLDPWRQPTVPVTTKINSCLDKMTSFMFKKSVQLFTKNI